MYLVYIGLALLAVFATIPLIVNAFLRNVEAGEIRLVSWMGGKLKIYRGPCKSTLIPMLTVSKVIPCRPSTSTSRSRIKPPTWTPAAGPLPSK